MWLQEIAKHMIVPVLCAEVAAHIPLDHKDWKKIPIESFRRLAGTLLQ